MKKNNNTATASKFDAYQMVTDRIIALMESGVIPWARPWTGCNAASGAWSRRKRVALYKLFSLLFPRIALKYIYLCPWKAG